MELTREEMMQAVTEGVRLAFREELENGFEYLDVNVSVKQGIMEAFKERLEVVSLKNAIAKGVEAAFDQVFPSQILHAIADGVREAHLGR